MDKASRQAISLTGLGLGATVVALAIPPLWPHASWYVWLGLLWVGIIVIVFSLLVLLHLQLTTRKLRVLYIIILTAIVATSVWRYTTLPDPSPVSITELYITDFPEYVSLRVRLNLIQ